MLIRSMGEMSIPETEEAVIRRGTHFIQCYDCFSRQDPQRGCVPSLQVYGRASLPPCVKHQGQLLIQGGQKGAQDY